MYSGLIIGVVLGFLGAAFCRRLIINRMLQKMIRQAEEESLALIVQSAELYYSCSGLLDLVAMSVPDAEKARVLLTKKVLDHRHAQWKKESLAHVFSYHPGYSEGDFLSWDQAMTHIIKTTKGAEKESIFNGEKEGHKNRRN